jgi:alpha-beta hydrolase superfamily lysophospholipase
MKQTLKTVNSADHQTLHADYYQAKKPKGLVVVFHGMAEHKDRYAEFANSFVKNGFCVLLCDHRGHGESLFNNQLKGHFADSNGWLRNLEDLEQLVVQAQKLSGQEKFVLLGHSMGSMFARSYFKRHNNQISHLLLTGVPGIPNNVGVLHNAIKLLALPNPQKPSRFLYKASFGGFDKKSKGGKNLGWLSNDPKKIAAYQADPLCGFYFTNKGFEDLAFGMKDIVNIKDYPSDVINTKIWMIVGEDDVTVDMDQIQSMISILQSKGYQTPSVSVIPGAAHEVLFEEGKEHIYKEILDFMQS